MSTSQRQKDSDSNEVLHNIINADMAARKFVEEMMRKDEDEKRLAQMEERIYQRVMKDLESTNVKLKIKDNVKKQILDALK